VLTDELTGSQNQGERNETQILDVVENTNIVPASRKNLGQRPGIIGASVINEYYFPAVFVRE